MNVRVSKEKGNRKTPLCASIENTVVDSRMSEGKVVIIEVGVGYCGKGTNFNKIKTPPARSFDQLVQ